LSYDKSRDFLRKSVKGDAKTTNSITNGCQEHP